MSKSLVERKIKSSIETLEMIHRKLKATQDAELQKLGRQAREASYELESARLEMHSHWEEK